jgi:hypothetical protein
MEIEKCKEESDFLPTHHHHNRVVVVCVSDLWLSFLCESCNKCMDENMIMPLEGLFTFHINAEHE